MKAVQKDRCVKSLLLQQLAYALGDSCENVETKPVNVGCTTAAENKKLQQAHFTTGHVQKPELALEVKCHDVRS